MPNVDNSQNLIDVALVEYQAALLKNNEYAKQVAYDKICNLYQPIAFMNVWWDKYSYLFDSKEDFEQDYIFKFITTLKKWQPRTVRPESRYGGKGDFKNYFIGTLSHHYSNMVKQNATGKRNLTVNCPICLVKCASLSTHILKSHFSLMIKQLEEYGYKLEELDNCPFCKNFKLKKTGTILSQIIKHLETKHTSIIFDKFKEDYPEYNIFNPKINSNFIEDEKTGASKDIYESLGDNNSKINSLLDSNLSRIQQQILDMIFLNKTKKILYDKHIYDCTPNEFKYEIKDLQDKMSIFGIEG